MGSIIKQIDIWKYNISLLFASTLLLQPILLLFYQDNGLGAKDLFFFQGIFYLICVLAEFPIGYLSDKFSRRNLLGCSFILLIIISSIWLYFKGYWIILAGEVLFAISKTIRDNASSGYLYDYLHGENMVKYYGYLHFFFSGGTVISAILGTYLYSKYGGSMVLVYCLIFFTLAFVLLMSLPNITDKKRTYTFRTFYKSIKTIYQNENVRWYIFYSGFFASMSILFAISFQPLMQNSLFPVALFGVVALINHGIRSLSGVVSSKFFNNTHIKNLIIPLYFAYIVAFGCVFLILKNYVIYKTLALLTAICIIIGFQLIFTILHISRLHKFVTIQYRGSLMSLNNSISRLMTAIALISTRLFITKLDLNVFYILVFAIYLVLGAFFTIKAYKVEE